MRNAFDRVGLKMFPNFGQPRPKSTTASTKNALKLISFNETLILLVFAILVSCLGSFFYVAFLANKVAPWGPNNGFRVLLYSIIVSSPPLEKEIDLKIPHDGLHTGAESGFK